MRTGTKSLLFGVHQFLWHPITVFLAWCELYGLPTLKELICIVIHDWGYWGSPNMDGKEGERHPEFAARLAHEYLDLEEWVPISERDKHHYSVTSDDPSFMVLTKHIDYLELCLYHSRHYAKRNNKLPSKLCWADKLSIKYDPWWFYLTRAWLSGELEEYLALHSRMGESFKTRREWYSWASKRAIAMGKAMSSEGISYHPDPNEQKN